MIMLWLATGVDPYEGDPEALNELLKHPALAIELDPADTITWPSTYAQPANPHHGIAFDAEDHGLLSHFGYHVGKKAPSQARRREAILKALRQPLSNTDFSDTYVLDCGPPNSQQRLQKIINALAAFIRNGKRRGPGHQLAVEHWQQDLDWLEESFG